MSKHRVKAVTLDDDYDDYDEGDDDDEGGQDTLTADDKEQLRLSTIKVRTSLGPNFPATDEEIQDSLWHYYYDVGKTVSYLKNKQSSQAKTSKQTPTTSFTSTTGSTIKISCPEPFSAKNFFHDCPWFNVPLPRRADILVGPLYPRFGLLGGAPAGEGKMSKLAALAARRRQKENERTNAAPDNNSLREDEAATNLGRLRIVPDQGKAAGNERSLGELQAPVTTRSPTQVAKTSGERTSASEKEQPVRDVNDGAPPPLSSFEPLMGGNNIRAQPSPFASLMTGLSPPSSGHKTNPIPHTATDSRGLTGALTKSFDFTEPSPDDVVTTAQISKGQKFTKAPPKQKNTPKPSGELNNGVKALSLDESTRVKSKNLDVIAEYNKLQRKNAANFVVIGHVDAGKSTLMGRLLYDLKAIDQRTMDKYKKEADRIGKGSFAFAWVLDQGTEERARGVTIDIATNKFETDKTSFTILDAPGHRDFVPNMIAGASQADFAVLVIDASTGNFESGLKGQTKEHALLVRSMGVQKIIVAVNKMDAAEWSQERFQEIRQQMSAFLTTAGFQAKNVSFIPCSGLHGDNILRKSQEQKISWYDGHTLVEELETSEPTSHALDKPLRMTIGDVFRGGVTNPLSVSGRVESGTLQVGDQVLVMPSSEKAFIKGVEVDDEPGDWAVAGQNIILHLVDIDAVHLKTGDIVCSPSSPIQNTTTFNAKVLAFELLTPMHLDIHRGRLHVPGRISRLVAILDKASGAVAKKKPKIVPPGSVARIVVEMDQAVPLEAGRIVLRANGDTVAAGFIE